MEQNGGVQTKHVIELKVAKEKTKPPPETLTKVSLSRVERMNRMTCHKTIAKNNNTRRQTML